MVKDESLYLIDPASLFDKNHKTFLGAPLLFDKDKDNDVTFLYGFLKDFLTIRCGLKIRAGIVLISKECLEDASEKEVEAVAAFIKKMGLPVIDDRKSSVIDICSQYARFSSAIYSNNEALLQFSRPDLTIVRDNARKGYDYQNFDTIVKKYGVAPDKMATFLALTGGPKDSGITRNQAVRLVESFGSLEDIFASQSSFPNPRLRVRLTENEAAIFTRYRALTSSEVREEGLMKNFEDCSLHLDTDKNTKLLHKLGMHSLVRLLGPLPKEDSIVQVKSAGLPFEIVDHEQGLKALSERLPNSEVWAIDTESSGRDPHSATLFGIAFSADNEKSCYVPLLDHDLKGISSSKAINIIRRLLEDGSRKFIGHNIKYDCLLLRRNGIHLKAIHFDTMLAAFECYGDLDFLNLGFLSKELLGKSKTSYKEILGQKDSPWDIPLPKLAGHACRDVETTFLLYKFLQKEIVSKGLPSQYFDHTLPLLKTLGDLEYLGIKVDQDKLHRFRDVLLKKANKLAQHINNSTGLDIIIASDEEVKHHFLSVLSLAEWKALKESFTAFLERLAINYEVPRLLILYRRLLKEINSVDAIIRSIKKGRIFPIFSQVKSKSGLVTAKQPDFFNTEYLKEFFFCFEKKLRPFFRDALPALNKIQALSGDEVLQQDLSGDPLVNCYLKNNPRLAGTDSNCLFLQMISGTPDSRLVSRFLIDKADLALIRKDLESRYKKLFSFLNKFKRDSFEKGFSEIEGKRKYLVGLKSPNLEKRRKAGQVAMEWLIGQ